MTWLCYKYAYLKCICVGYGYGGFRGFCGHVDSVGIPAGFSVGMRWISGSRSNPHGRLAFWAIGAWGQTDGQTQTLLTAPPPIWTGHNWRTVRVVRFKKQCTRSGVLGSMRVGAASNYQTVSAIHLVSRISRNWGIFVAVKIPLGLLVKRIYRQLNAITPPHRGFIGQCIIIMIVMIFLSPPVQSRRQEN